MPAKLTTALMSAGAAALTTVAVLGAATPAFAKSNTWLSGPRDAHPRHAFRLTVSVGDDGGAQPASARLQALGAHGRYHWLGPWHHLRLTDYWDESYAFTVTEQRPTTITFRVVVSGGYAITSPVTVVVRSGRGGGQAHAGHAGREHARARPRGAADVRPLGAGRPQGPDILAVRPGTAP